MITWEYVTYRVCRSNNETSCEQGNVPSACSRVPGVGLARRGRVYARGLRQAPLACGLLFARRAGVQWRNAIAQAAWR